MIKHIAQGNPICITVTLVRNLSSPPGVLEFLPLASVLSTQLDGIVVARSLFHSSMNYRSVVIFGTAEEIT
jgi:hypothetical protein